MKFYANWKLNKTSLDTIAFFQEFNKFSLNNTDEVCIFVSSPLITTAIASSNVSIGAQNIAVKTWGALTGETSVEQIADLGCEQVLVGHSERRNQFGETDDVIAEKMSLLQNYDVKVVLCVGEKLEERENMLDIIYRQIKKALSKRTDLKNIVIAYEPVWAIGTGLTPTTKEIEDTIISIKSFINSEYGINMPVLYGGSVNLQNVKDFKSIKDLDGFLIGGASLDASNFIKLIEA